MRLRNTQDGSVLHLHAAIRWPIAAGARQWDGSFIGGAWLWSLEDRWWLEVRLATDGYGGMARPYLRMNGFLIPGTVEQIQEQGGVMEAPPGSTIETDDGTWVMEREPDDPPDVRGGRAPRGTPPATSPDDARDAFSRGDAAFADAALTLARNTPRDARLRDAFRRASVSGEPALIAAGIRGLSLLASQGVLEPDAARKAIDRVESDAPLELRMTAAQALAGFDPLAAGPQLVALVREAFAEGELARETEECARILMSDRVRESALVEELLRDAQAVSADASARKRRASATRVLGVLAAAGEGRATRVLRSLVADPHETVRLAAVRAAAPLGDEVLEMLVEGAGDDDERVRSEAFEALRSRAGAAERLLAAIDAALPGPRRDHLYTALERLT